MKGLKGFQKGISGNPNGRKRGSENLATGTVRSLWQDLMTENIDQFKEDFKTLKPEKRLELAVKMSGFILPRLQSLEIDNFPEWAELVMLSPEERASEIIKLKKEIEADEED